MSVSVGYILSLVDSTIMKNGWNSCNLGQAYEDEDSWNMTNLNKQSESLGLGSRQVNVKHFTKVGLCWTAEKSRWKGPAVPLTFSNETAKLGDCG